jgi:hypothetical protein
MSLATDQVSPGADPDRVDEIIVAGIVWYPGFDWDVFGDHREPGPNHHGLQNNTSGFPASVKIGLILAVPENFPGQSQLVLLVILQSICLFML